MTARQYSPFDHLLLHLDQAVRTVFGRPQTTGRYNPAQAIAEVAMSPTEQQHSTRLMRINHSGEVCAQALYQGQALTARHQSVRDRLEQAATEENDHLDWCAARIKELGGHTSVLNPLFYAGSLLIGALNGMAGDRWNLGFLAETEEQVVRHLEDHLQRLPNQDHKSRAILGTMKADEGHHATMALQAGGAKLPLPARLLMKVAAKVMTTTTHWI
jgi:ubiquinone biosynthesis monooxygenase Coq7